MFKQTRSPNPCYIIHKTRLIFLYLPTDLEPLGKIVKMDYLIIEWNNNNIRMEPRFRTHSLYQFISLRIRCITYIINILEMLLRLPIPPFIKVY